MPAHLKRFYGHHDLHFITFSSYGRKEFLSTAQRRDLLLQVLEQMRQRYRFVVVGYVVMPEHVHLLENRGQTGHTPISYRTVLLAQTKAPLPGQRNRARLYITSNLRQRIENLSAAEKAELLDAVWESLQADALSMTDEQRAELDHRLDRHEKNHSDVIPWEQVRASLFKKL